MNETPFFSIIIPAYNSEKHIRNALESVRRQTFQNYELIVVCDSCTDRTEEVAREYGAITKNVENHLDGLTRNDGIEMAKGEWLLFMDDDDWFLHEFALEMLAGMVGKHDEDVLIFSFIWKDKGYYRSTPDNIQVQAWSKCFRRSFVGDARFSNRHYWSDCDFHNAIMRKPHKFVFWDMPLYYYNFFREGSVTEQYIGKQIRDFGHPVNVILKDVYNEKGEKL